MFTVRSPVIAALLLTLGASPAWAGSDDTYRADRRESQQMDRIEQGVREGDLTKREKDELLTQQRNITDYEKQIKADGHVTPRERMELQVKQNKANRRIAEEKNDEQRR
jgi:E3 ubiquitin-protein ligase DOA10